jgi:hypothetical protein
MSRLRVNVFGIELDCIDQATLISELLNRACLEIPGYVIPINLRMPLCQAAEREKRSVFFFGRTFDILIECARRLYALIDGLEIRGVYAPPFRFERDPSRRESHKSSGTGPRVCGAWCRASILSRANNGVPPWPFAAGVRMALAGTLRASPAWHTLRDNVVWLPILVASDRISARRDAR